MFNPYLNNNHLQLYFRWNWINKNKLRDLLRNLNKLIFKYLLIISKEKLLWLMVRSFIKISILSKNYYLPLPKEWLHFLKNFKNLWIILKKSILKLKADSTLASFWGNILWDAIIICILTRICPNCCHNTQKYKI